MGKNVLRILMVLGVCLFFGTGQVAALPYAWDPMADGDDSYWSLGSEYGTLQILMEVAGYADRNEFGAYHGDTLYPIITPEMNTSTPAFDVNMADIAAALGSSHFGFYLDSPDGLFFSDTKMNRDKADHLLTWLGEEGEIFLGWEDLNGNNPNNDYDYDDLVIAIRKFVPGAAPAPVPEPGTLLLIGSGLLGLASCRKKRSS